ncbi:MAG TPA: polysaccharide biosynthesis/export family protein [Candidatus Acidoferrales bacterium]|nr:polysaccharide biosynthesis/export family protein [Candidatus Acidoferrales bacterium]
MKLVHVFAPTFFALIAANLGAAQDLRKPPLAQAGAAQSRAAEPTSASPGGSYTLGIEDQITVRALHVEEITEVPIRIGGDGNIRLPLAGLIHAVGMTVGQLEDAIVVRLRPFVLEPEVSISVTEFRSGPVSVLGAVKNPGIYQVQGHKTVAEVLSLAGGPDPTAGSVVKITREVGRGPIPVAGASIDFSGKFGVAEISLVSILKADHPQDNIAIQAHDIVTVPRAEMVYVIGEVQRPGGFVLTDGKAISLLQALSLAGGLDKVAQPKRASLLRPTPGSTTRTEIPVDLSKIMAAHASDVAMLPGDILFVPNNAPKQAFLRGAEAAIQMGTGVVIWHK